MGPLSIVERLLNNAIQFDVNTPKKLQKLKNIYFQVKLTDFNIAVYGHFDHQGLIFSNTLPETVIPAVTIRASSFVLMGLALTKNTHAATKRGLTIEGSTEIAEQIQDFFLNLNVDWEEILSRFTGDEIAHTAFQCLNALRRKKTRFFESLTKSTHDYLIEESHLIPHPLEVERFINEVDNVRAEIDRCEARINRLISRREP